MYVDVYSMQIYVVLLTYLNSIQYNIYTKGRQLTLHRTSTTLRKNG